MPRRLIPLVNDEFYHVYNRGIDHRITFLTQGDYVRALFTLKYYQYSDIPGRLSHLNKLPFEQRTNILKDIFKKGNKIAEVIAYTLMPNHFHFVIRQIKDGGIRILLSKFENSYTKYFNLKTHRDGALFLDQFKAVRIVSQEQFIHVVRYVHLNPYSSYLVKNVNELLEYPWSSFKEYLGKTNNSFCEKSAVLDIFKNDAKKFKQFCLDQADYQRKLESIKHLIMDTPEV